MYTVIFVIFVKAWHKSRTRGSLRSWRYCVGVRLKFWRRSRVPKKGNRDEAVVFLRDCFSPE